MQDIIDPQILAATSVSLYWICVIFMVARSWVRFRGPAGAIPKTKLERRMWIVWVPTLLAWNVLVWTTSNQVTISLENHASTALSNTWMVATWAAGIIAVAVFICTVYCWIMMGRNWSMAITPGKDTELITNGAFSFVRHPIYALSLFLMLSSMFAVFNVWMLIVATIHISMLMTKAFNEERYLTQLHGDLYRTYCARTNRFLPLRAIRRFA